YERTVGWVLRRTGRALIVYLALIAAMAGLFLKLPTGFLPEEDQGSIINMVQLPAGATMDRTRKVMEQVTRHYLEDEKDNVEAVMAITGFSFSGRGQNAGLAFVRLKDWGERPKAAQHAPAVAGRAMRAFSKFKDGLAFAFVPPAVPELGNATGFELQLQDRGNLGHEGLMAARNQLLGMAAQDARLAKVRPLGLEDTPQYRVDVDQQKAAALGLSLGDINATLSSTWGINYVNDFVDKGRTKRVYMQADAPFRMKPEDLNRWYVRNRAGQMVPFSAFSTGTWVYGPTKLERFNGFPAMVIQGEPSPGHSSGEAMAAMAEHVKALPAGVGLEWSGLSYEERLSGANAPALYAISLLVVFLALAALYESWSIPVSVMLVVPLGVLGAVVATELGGMVAGVYFQVGLLTTIGLSAKNAILIVEFAKALHEEGASLLDAAVEAARMRLRPIIMTSLAFILGVLPLALANGAGAASQNAIGVAVIGGMLSATFLAILLVPVFFVRVAGGRRRPPPAEVLPGPGASGEGREAANA
ncbi:MAG TPA: efflux RND transporter permease subunit, partial [Anaeromyxobacteraceae bacterium]|nr:efflux RND transporter permease subunit [Anaeromyxobacteraceae bacterium]